MEELTSLTNLNPTSPTVSSKMRSNHLIIEVFCEEFSLNCLFTSSLLIIIVWNMQHCKEFIGQILISASGHASVLISKLWGVFYVVIVSCDHRKPTSKMTIHASTQKRKNKPWEPREKRNREQKCLGEMVFVMNSNQHINSNPSQHSGWRWEGAWDVKISLGVSDALNHRFP